LFLKNPFCFGLSICVIIALQVGAAFISFRYFLDGDLIIGFACFFLVPFLALIAGFYFFWFRTQRKASSLK
jgi:hypothetical protein